MMQNSHGGLHGHAAALWTKVQWQRPGPKVPMNHATLVGVPAVGPSVPGHPDPAGGWGRQPQASHYMSAHAYW
jgi:hypothetical protein